MTSLHVTVSFLNKSTPGEVSLDVNGRLSVAEVKTMILEHLRLAKTLSIKQIVLLFCSEANIDRNYASSPFSGAQKVWLLVFDEDTLESFLEGPTLIEFKLYQK